MMEIASVSILAPGSLWNIGQLHGYQSDKERELILHNTGDQINPSFGYPFPHNVPCREAELNDDGSVRVEFYDRTVAVIPSHRVYWYHPK